MTATSSSRNFNVIALRGGSVTDQEYIETFNLDPSLAGTPALNDAMLELQYKNNLDNGVAEDRAMALRNNAERDVKRLLAKNGMLK